jgi:hypothetical protein
MEKLLRDEMKDAEDFRMHVELFVRFINDPGT